MVISLELFRTKKQKEKIAEENKQQVIAHLQRGIKDGILTGEGYLISDEQALRTAYQMFYTAKEMGRIDDTNRVVG
jgi:hypothetical protein